MLLEHVPGEDFYDVGLAERVRLGALAHRIQLASIDGLAELVAAGVPDRRGPAQAEWIRQRLAGWSHGHPAEALLEDLDLRLEELDGCGLPYTLVHGDAHPGNVRGDAERMVFLDWGDAFVGNPVFDVRGMTGGRPADEARAYEQAWVRAGGRAASPAATRPGQPSSRARSRHFASRRSTRTSSPTSSPLNTLSTRTTYASTSTPPSPSPSQHTKWGLSGLRIRRRTLSQRGED